jgi:hypothetical protein
MRYRRKYLANHHDRKYAQNACTIIIVFTPVCPQALGGRMREGLSKEMLERHAVDLGKLIEIICMQAGRLEQLEATIRKLKGINEQLEGMIRKLDERLKQ